VNRRATIRLYGLVGLAVLAFGASLAARRPELAAAGAAFAAVVAVGLGAHRWPTVTSSVAFDPPRAIEGDTIGLVVELHSDRAIDWLEVELELPANLDSVDGVQRRVITLPAGVTRAVRFAVRPRVWGLVPPGRLRLVARDRFGLLSSSLTSTPPGAVRVYPAEGRLGGLVAPARTGATLGAHLSAARGDGCEYADVRPYRPGDRLGAVNWRVSARRGRPWVTERHPERASDVVLVLDDTGEVGVGDDTTLRRAVRAARALAESHLAVQDRVGLLALGSPLRWYRPRVGRAQLYALVDVLLDSQAARSPGPAGRDLLTVTGLAPGTTVVALTTLTDGRVVEQIADFRRAGHHVIVVESPAAELLVPPAGLVEVTARRLWEAEHRAVRRRLVALGIPCVAWDGASPLEAVLFAARPRAAGRR
jgi:uncharacterized protein (DUF58 family)